MGDLPVAAQAVLATLAISVLPTLVLFAIPCCSKRRGEAKNPIPTRLLRVLLGFAVGGLLGDALLHLIPHAIMPAHSHAAPVPAADATLAAAAHAHSHDDGHSHSHGEAAPLKLQKTEHEHGHAAHSHSHGHHDDHSHSHGHGHAEAEKHDHGHSHSAAEGHGHSHGGKPCTGHGHSHGGEHKQTEKHEHGHSHSHGDHDHGHSHGAEVKAAKAAPAAHDHGHSHSHGGHGHDDHDHDHGAFTRVGLLVLAGVLAFFLLEKAAVVCRGGAGGHGHSHGGHGHGHSHGAGSVHSAPVAAAAAAAESDDDEEEDDNGKGKGKKTTLRNRNKTAATPAKTTKASSSSSKAVSVNSSDACSAEAAEETSVAGMLAASPSALLNVVADLAHNFTDGLAIAAAFSAGQKVGLTTSLAVLVHEVPHELGDFAVLLQAGLPVAAALKMQFVTALGALLGVCAGLAAAEAVEGASRVILPLTAGGFIYVGLVGVLPALLQPLHKAEEEAGDAEPGAVVDRWRELGDVVGVVAAMATGVALMVLIGEFE